LSDIGREPTPGPLSGQDPPDPANGAEAQGWPEVRWGADLSLSAIVKARPLSGGWLWVIVSVEAIKRAGQNLTGESIKKALESLKDFDTRGRLVQIKGGKIVQMKECCG
jgi:hypothetical protein